MNTDTRLRPWLARCAAVLALAAASCAGAQQLTLMTEDYPPFNMATPDHGLQGIATDLVRELMREGNIQYSLRALPWARAAHTARTRPLHCAFSMARTPERESEYSWVGPLAFNDLALFARKIPQGKRPPQSLDEVKGQRIGSYLGDAGLPYLTALGHLVDAAPNDDLNPNKLAMGRLDYWAVGKLPGLYRLRMRQMTGIEPVLTIGRVELYLACHAGMPQPLLERLNRQLAELHQRGVVAQIYRRYGYSPD